MSDKNCLYDTQKVAQLLRLSASEWPPDHYTILGLQLFENDRKLITRAALQRSSILRRMETDVTKARIHIVLQQIVTAQKCLLDSDAKYDYDLRLQNQIRSVTGASSNAASDCIDNTISKIQHDNPAVIPPPRLTKKVSSIFPSTSSIDGEYLEDLSNSNSILTETSLSKSNIVSSPVRLKRNPSVLDQQRNRSNSTNTLFVWSVTVIVGIVLIVLVVMLSGKQERRQALDSEEGNKDIQQQANNVTTSPSNRVHEGQMPDLPHASNKTEIASEPVNSKQVPQLPADPNAGPMANPVCEDTLTQQVTENHKDIVPSINPFSNLPQEIDLPQVIVETSTFYSGNPGSISFGNLVGNMSKQAKLSVYDEAASLEGLYDFDIHCDPKQVQGVVWGIYLVSKNKLGQKDPDQSDIKDGSLSAKPVAMLSTSGGRLTFSWGEASGHRFAEQLRNCILELVDGAFQHQMRLRTIQTKNPYQIDLEENRVAIPLSGSGMPSTDSLFLELISCDGFPNSWQHHPQGKRLKNGGEILISGGDPKIEFYIRLQEIDELPHIVIFAYYYRDDNKESLARDLLEKRIKSNQGRLNSTKRIFAKAKANTRAISDQLSETRRWSERNGTELMTKMKTIDRLTRELNSCNRTIERLTTTIPQAEAAQQELIELARLAGQLHRQATLSFRVGVPTHRGDFDLCVYQ